MHIPDLREDDSISEKVAQEFLSQGRKKEITSVILSILNDEFYCLEEYASSHISDIAKTRAEAFLKKVLQGDKDAAIALFGAGDEHRYRQMGYDKDKPWASLIHGSLFETDEMELHRRLVEVHADLLRNERIRDLESTVEGLIRQIKILEKQLSDRWNQL